MFKNLIAAGPIIVSWADSALAQDIGEGATIQTMCGFIEITVAVEEHDKIGGLCL
jgi:hypothetical protein